MSANVHTLLVFRREEHHFSDHFHRRALFGASRVEAVLRKLHCVSARNSLRVHVLCYDKIPVVLSGIPPAVDEVSFESDHTDKFTIIVQCNKIRHTCANLEREDWSTIVWLAVSDNVQVVEVHNGVEVH